MEINELMMLADEDIDYGSLSVDTLKELALGDELFIATSALGELSQRNGSVAASTAWEILLKLRGDCYLQAAALETIFELDQEKALDYIREQAPKCNTYILNSVLEIMIENESVFRSKNVLPVVSIVIQRLKELDSTTQYPEPEVRDNFLNMYNDITNLQVADALT
ncbi:hypothetical protein NIES4071_78750 [Calothrix sp. NIES-4071]|nr:hypothetical protein NIES4071_78750 [Calothrix sp. NIES-4071]BAZ62147.1 hypothetical protein NIES4105_78680 [Calothrix sp. NIES-4105]